MYLSRLMISEILGIEHLELDVHKVTKAKGPNAKGKSSLIEALQLAINGSSDHRVIRNGADEGEIFLQLDDGMSIRRVFSPGGTRLTVKDGDGKRVPAAQTFLKKLLGALAFNPIKFFDLSAKERKQYLLKALPVTVDKETVGQWCGEVPPINLDQHGLEVIKELEKLYYDKRAGVHEVVQNKEGGVEEIAKKIPENFDADKARALNVQGLTAIITEQETAETAKTEKQITLAGLKEDVAVKEAEIEQLLVRINKAKKDAVEADEKLTKAKQDVTTVQFPDAAKVQEARDKLDAYDKTKENLHNHDMMKRLENEGIQLRKKWKTLDTLVKFLQTDALKSIMDSMPPVAKGLKMEGDDLTLNNVPIDQLSTSEQMRFTIEIAKALSGDLKVVCVDGIERLDPAVRKQFIEDCKEDDYQYVLAEVAGGEFKVTSKR